MNMASNTQINMSEINHQDRSLNNMIQNENHSLKDHEYVKPHQAIQYGDQRLVPYFLGGHQGYYSDLTIVPSYDAIELVIEVLALAILVLTWIFYQIQFNKFPNQIPIIYDSEGNVIQQGQKLILYLFPSLDTFIFVILTILQFITNRFRYHIQVTPENSTSIFRLTRKLILASKLITLILFVFLTFGSISIVNNTLNGYILSYAVLVVIVYGSVYYFYQMELQKIIDKTI